MSIDSIKNAIRDVYDFPKKGIVFKDITPILQDAELFHHTIDILAEKCKQWNPAYICGVESRGFIFGAAIAYKLGLSFVPIRKPGKLPAETFVMEYNLEYGSSKLEIHKDSFKPNAQVVIVDDLLATGGTAKASVNLVEMCGANVLGLLFLVELAFLEGRKDLTNYEIEALIDY